MIKRRAIPVVLTLLCAAVLTLFPPSAGAAGGDIMFSDPSVIVGGSVNVNVYSTGSIAGIDLTLVYDTDLLAYTGFSGGLGNAAVQASGGSLHIVDYSASADARFSLNLSFTAKAVGTAVTRPTACTGSDAGGDELSVEYQSHSAKVSITSASGNCDLSALYIDPGTLSPAFSSHTTEYSVTVPNGATWLAVTPVKSDASASYTVSGNESLRVGVNYVTVTVTAGNGTQKVYTLTVTRQEAAAAAPAATNAPTPAPSAAPTPSPSSTPTASPAASPSATPAAATASPMPSPSPTAPASPVPESREDTEALSRAEEKISDLQWKLRVFIITSAVLFVSTAVLGVLLIRTLTAGPSRRRGKTPRK